MATHRNGNHCCFSQMFPEFSQYKDHIPFMWLNLMRNFCQVHCGRSLHICGVYGAPMFLQRCHPNSLIYTPVQKLCWSKLPVAVLQSKANMWSHVYEWEGKKTNLCIKSQQTCIWGKSKVTQQILVYRLVRIHRARRQTQPQYNFRTEILFSYAHSWDPRQAFFS